jgi:hypothetical protein
MLLSRNKWETFFQIVWPSQNILTLSTFFLLLHFSFIISILISQVMKQTLLPFLEQLSEEILHNTAKL